ncbi:hypothetical protein ACE0DR_21315 [Azotobacter sp. CWF10]
MQLGCNETEARDRAWLIYAYQQSLSQVQAGADPKEKAQRSARLLDILLSLPSQSRKRAEPDRPLFSAGFVFVGNSIRVSLNARPTQDVEACPPFTLSSPRPGFS